MNNIIILHKPTKELSYHVAYLIPYEVYETTIFKRNFKNIPRLLNKRFLIMEKINICNRMMSKAIFDKEKEIVRNDILKLKSELELVILEMNSDISPYHWNLLGEYHGFINESRIDVDCLVVFDKEENR